MSTAIKSRPPTGIAPWPPIVVAGEEKSGKTLLTARLSTSDLIGPMYWFDLAEGAGDEYGALKGAAYQIIDHDGTYRDILQQGMRR